MKKPNTNRVTVTKARSLLVKMIKGLKMTASIETPRMMARSSSLMSPGQLMKLRWLTRSCAQSWSA